MTAQRSMTDEQILAKYGYDKEPWEDTQGQRRKTQFGLHYTPRPECIPSRPQWTRLPDGTRMNNGFIAKRPPVNPILSTFRADKFMDLEATLDITNLEWMKDFDATPDHVEFARKVLTRLAALA